MAVATEHGLFIAGEMAEPASGADGDGLDGRPGSRPPARTAGQGGHGRDQHAVHGVPRDPVRGSKQSGFGRELGLETLDAYLETKSVIVSTSPKPFNPFGL